MEKLAKIFNNIKCIILLIDAMEIKPKFWDK